MQFSNNDFIKGKKLSNPAGPVWKHTELPPRAHEWLIQEVTKDVDQLQALLISVKVSVHDSSTGKKLRKNDIQRVPPMNKKDTEYFSESLFDNYLAKIVHTMFYIGNLYTEREKIKSNETIHYTQRSYN